MRRLIYYEIKKLITPTSIFMFFIAILMVIRFPVKVFTSHTIDENGREITGKKAIEYLKEHDNRKSLITDEQIKKDLIDLKNQVEKSPIDYENMEEAFEKLYSNTYFQSNARYIGWIYDLYDSPLKPLQNGFLDLVKEQNGLKAFSKARLENLAMENDALNLSDNEKNVLRHKAVETNPPWKTGYFTGWSILKNVQTNVRPFMLVLGLIVAGIFFKEHLFKTDIYIKTAKDAVKSGKSKMFAVWILLCFVLLIYFLIEEIPVLSFFGVDGASFPVQLYDAKSLSKMNLLEDHLFDWIMVILNITSIAGSVFLVALAWKKAPVSYLLVVVIFVFFTILLNYGYEMSWGEIFFNNAKVFALFPLLSLFLAGYSDLIVYSVFGFWIDYYPIAIISHVLFTIISFSASIKLLEKNAK